MFRRIRWFNVVFVLLPLLGAALLLGLLPMAGIAPHVAVVEAAPVPLEFIRENATGAEQPATQLLYTSAETPPGLSTADWAAITRQLPQQALAVTEAEDGYFELNSSNPFDGKYFGRAVAIDGNTVVVGEPAWSDNLAQLGRAYVFVRSNGTWIEQAVLQPSPGVIGDEFGRSVAISGDTVVVGALESEPDHNETGSAYVFVRNGTTWSQQARLKASNGDPYYGYIFFGWSVSISGDTIVVGAPREQSAATGINGNENDHTANTAGAAYVFVRSGTTWSQQAYVKASDTSTGAFFGDGVAIDGDTLLVGASEVDKVYFFTRNGTTWSQQADFRVTSGEGFGTAVALDGDTAVVGACVEGVVDKGPGDAYIYVRNGATWSQQAHLTPSNGDANDDFGYSVAISGDTVVVGSPIESGSATGINGIHDNATYVAGAAYVFVRSGMTWSQQAYVKAPSTPYEGDWFGVSVTIADDTLVVGANRRTGASYGSGVAYALTLGKSVAPAYDVPYHGIITYTLSLRGPFDQIDAGVRLTDTLPPEVDFVQWIEQPVGAEVTDGQISWTGSLEANQILPFIFQARHVGNYGDRVTNSAEWQGAVLDYRTAVATFNVEPPPPLYLAKTVTPTQAAPGEVVTYTLRFTNTTYASATDVVITDTLPTQILNPQASSSVSITAQSGTQYVWELDNALYARASGTITITGQVASGTSSGPLTNTATIAGLIDEVSRQHSSSVVLDVTAPVQFVLTTAITGTGSGTISPTVGTHTYAPGTVVTLTATPAPTSTFDGWSGDADCADGNVIMDAHKTCTATFTPVFIIGKTAEEYQNAPPLLENDRILYTIRVTNTSASAISAVVITDTLPAGVSYFGIPKGSPRPDQTGNPVVWTLASLDAGATQMFKVIVKVDGTANPIGVNQATATCTEASTPTTASAQVAGDGVHEPGLVISGTVGSRTLRQRREPAVALAVGDLFTYTLTATNNNTTLTLHNLVVTATLPSGAELVSATPPGSVVLPYLRWTQATLGPGAIWQAEVVLRQTGTTLGSLELVAASDEQSPVEITITSPGVSEYYVYLPLILR